MTAKTQKQRSAEFRARKAASKLHEVRGIYLPLEIHPHVKSYADAVMQAYFGNMRAKEKA